MIKYDAVKDKWADTDDPNWFMPPVPLMDVRDQALKTFSTTEEFFAWYGENLFKNDPKISSLIKDGEVHFSGGIHMSEEDDDLEDDLLGLGSNMLFDDEDFDDGLGDGGEFGGGGASGDF